MHEIIKVIQRILHIPRKCIIVQLTLIISNQKGAKL